MKQIILIILLLVTFSTYSSAQKLPELEKVKEIKLLEHTREDVRRILAEYKLETPASPNYVDIFETENAEIEISYSDGKCDMEADFAGWEVAEWKVTQIKITPKVILKLRNLGLDLSKFKKENRYNNHKSPKLYYHKNLGVMMTSDLGEVEEIVFMPPQKDILKLCDKKLAKNLLETSSWLIVPIKDRNIFIDLRVFVSVTNLVLSAYEITADCSNTDSGINKNCAKNPKEIAVLTVPDNPDNDVLTYNYSVTGGKIVGVGGKANYLSDKVFWDLSDVKPGTYTITAAVDNGCGFCGKTVTKTVTVKECADCNKP